MESISLDLSEQEVLFAHDGRLGLITLNRPAALNALTHGMVTEIQAQLDEWAVDGTVSTVAIMGAGERGLCAGGDIVALYRDATSGGGASSAAFWSDEYRLNATIAAYPKPYVALMDGVVLGGGIGLSAHGSHRVVTERSRLGMPETGIGFIPDVGGTWLLSRAPGELGTHLALSGAMVGAGDAIALGLADAYVPSDHRDALLTSLRETDADSALAEHAQSAPASPLVQRQSELDAAYAGNDVSAIIGRMRASAHEDDRTVAEVIAARSPLALSVTLEALRRAAAYESLEDALRVEFRLACRSLRWPDFAEGVRAQVIDKDRSPTWNPVSLNDVDAHAVLRAFAPLDELERAALATTEWSPR